MTGEDARRLFAAARVATLGSLTAAGDPHLVPVTFAVDGDTVWTAVDGKPKRDGGLRRHENIRRRPGVSLLAQEWDEDWSRLWWVRADGSAVVTDEPAAVARAVELLCAKYRQYAEVRVGGPVIEVTISGWRGWRYEG
ncbi:TIGR03668 family PPOX class F420-dependent oxidoreductase [Rugosimonospora africana]|uniref:TIGR03668 family PPOX class F420-dependent oxidoreductase n=1 Tax=Rugosimonospora africana TaxID=556532 RepID=UPI001EF28E6F|nr:TIGR03668 family PPOX class F420-dependent oxidoreductase [Rugosimonospora africana]